MEFKKVKVLLSVIMIMSLLFVFTPMQASAESIKVVDQNITYQVYYPIVGWTTTNTETRYVDLNYTNGYSFSRVVTYTVPLNDWVFDSRAIVDQYFYNVY